MHSMGMSMVRERSVKSFLERIQCRKHGEDMPLSAVTAPGTYLPPPKSAVGWLELRKVQHSTTQCSVTYNRNYRGRLSK